ncbi:hypothetical protein Aperf_G00000070430 [Anoplocephala perfoliata]
MSPLPKNFQISKSPQNSVQVSNNEERSQSARQQALVQAVQNTIKAASDMMNFKQKPKGSKRFEVRILEELEKLFESESDQFYFAKHGGDLTLWTQRRESRRMRGELCDWKDLKSTPRTYWRPIWSRYDDAFIWNHRILQNLVDLALKFLKDIEGLPSSVIDPESPSPTYMEDAEKGVEMDESMLQDDPPLVEGAGPQTHLTACLCALESMFLPVISGFVKQDKLSLPMWDVDGRISSNESDNVTLTIISRRSQFRAGCRYRRRGIDERGYVANYVETEQILEIPDESGAHIFSFLQIRGSVPVFWTQTGIKYKPPIQLHKSLSENRDAFRLHIERPLRKFDRLVVVNLVETTPGRQESKITEAFVRQLLLFNNPKVTYVGFDFHDYCKGFRFDNVAVLLDGVRDTITDMKFCWLHRGFFMCKQEGVFRVNCVDCLDRTNLVQSVFAITVVDSQLRKLGRLPPEVELPTAFARAVQAMWADNGDALSRHYTGTAAMKGDYTRTGFRTVNGLMKDGVSSMSRYYQRFGEIKRQAAIDFLLGQTNSSELRFLQNCSTPDAAVHELPSIETSSLLAAIRSTCLQSDEDSFFEFVASTTVRFVDDPLTNHQAHLRIPIQSINHVSLATETSLFKQPSPVLHIYFKAPNEYLSEQSIFSFNQAKRKDPVVDWAVPSGAAAVFATGAHVTSESVHVTTTGPPLLLSAEMDSFVIGDYRLALDLQLFFMDSHAFSVFWEGEHLILPLLCGDYLGVIFLFKAMAILSVIAGEGQSSDDARIESDAVPPKRPPQQSVSNQCRLDLRQAPFRLFNNYLVPISNDEEATDALRAVGESIMVVLNSLDPNMDLSTSTPPEIRNTGISVMQRHVAPILPTEYTQTLDKKVYSALQQRRDSLRAFLTSSRPSRRARRAQEISTDERSRLPESTGQRFWAFGSSTMSNKSPTSAMLLNRGAQTSESQNGKVIKRSFGRFFKPSLPLVEKVFRNTADPAKQNEARVNDKSGTVKVQGDSETELEGMVSATGEVDSRKQPGGVPVKVAAVAEPLGEVNDDSESTTTVDSDIDTLEQGVDALIGSDVDDLPTRTIKPTRCASFSDLLHELEDAAAVPVEDEEEEEERDEIDGDEFPEEGTPESAIVLNHAGADKAYTPTRPPKTVAILDVPASNSSSSSLPLFRLLTHNSRSQSLLNPINSGKRSQTPERDTCSAVGWENMFLQARSLSCECNRVRDHNLRPPKRSISDPLIICYREICDPKGVQGMLMPSRMKKSSLKEQLNQHFETFKIPSINRLQETANSPRFVTRLLQRQEENAAAVNHERDLICSPEDVIKTRFIVF